VRVSVGDSVDLDAFATDLGRPGSGIPA